jgi:hypothetical protein
MGGGSSSMPPPVLPYVIYLRAAEQTSHGAWFLKVLLNVEREKEIATVK